MKSYSKIQMKYKCSFIYQKELDNINSFLHWRFKFPEFWNIFDIQCWLIDLYYTKFKDPEEYYDLEIEIMYGKVLCEMGYEYFVSISHKYGLAIFEDLQLLISSFKPIEIDNLNYSKRLLFYDFIKQLLEYPIISDVIKWKDQNKRIFSILNKYKLARLWGNRVGNYKMKFDKMISVIAYCPYIRKKKSENENTYFIQ